MRKVPSKTASGRTVSFCLLPLKTFCVAVILGSQWGFAVSAAQKAAQIMATTGIDRGLAVHLSPKELSLSMALTNRQQMLVHALATDEKQLFHTRDYLLKTGFYGLAC